MVADELGPSRSPARAAIRNAWDGHRLQTLTKNSPLKADGAHISIVAHITEAEARARLTRIYLANGFANRFLFFLVRRSKLLAHGGNLDEASLLELGERTKRATEAARNLGRITMTEAASKAWEVAYPDLSADRPGLLGAVIARAEPQVIRLALAYALLDCTHQIDVVHLEAAMAVWAYCEESATRIFGDSLPLCHRVRQPHFVVAQLPHNRAEYPASAACAHGCCVLPSWPQLAAEKKHGHRPSPDSFSSCFSRSAWCRAASRSPLRNASRHFSSVRQCSIQRSSCSGVRSSSSSGAKRDS